MNDLITSEWIQKAEADFMAATELLKLQVETIADPVCFHCQQCAEKYIKAYLQHSSTEFPRTHNLLELLSFCRDLDDSFSAVVAEMQSLNNYGVEVRYPGRFTSFEEAEGAVQAMETVRTFIRMKLNLEKTKDSEDTET